MRPPPAGVVHYGDHPDLVANLHLPSDTLWPCSAVMLIHGGSWRDSWDRTLMTPVACDIALRGLIAWNVEYRRVGQEHGGWPGTLLDVAAAIDALVDVPEVDANSVVVVGHSAGGQLALWAAARHKLPPDAPGASPSVRPVAVVAQAGLCDLIRGALDGFGDGAIEDLVGGSPRQLPERYKTTSPASLLPLGTPQLLVHGTRDDVVPLTQSLEYADSARRAGDQVQMLEVEADHFDVIDPTHASWRAVADYVTQHLIPRSRKE